MAWEDQPKVVEWTAEGDGEYGAKEENVYDSARTGRSEHRMRIGLKVLFLLSVVKQQTILDRNKFRYKMRSRSRERRSRSRERRSRSRDRQRRRSRSRSRGRSPSYGINKI